MVSIVRAGKNEEILILHLQLQKEMLRYAIFNNINEKKNYSKKPQKLRTYVQNIDYSSNFKYKLQVF